MFQKQTFTLLNKKCCAKMFAVLAKLFNYYYYSCKMMVFAKVNLTIATNP